MANEAEKNTQQEVVSMELPAPPGWKKQFFPKRGGTPRKNDIVFTAPTGEEIYNQRQLQQYLKAHPGGASASEFNWGTQETPRRSSRISEKVKASPPEMEPPKKKGKRSSASKKHEDKTTTEETKPEEVEMEDAEKKGREKTVEGTEKDVEFQEAGTTEKEKTEKGAKNDIKMQEAESVEPEAVKEVANENHDEKDTTTKTKEFVSVDAIFGQDTSVPDGKIRKDTETERQLTKENVCSRSAHGQQPNNENASLECAKVKVEGQPNVPSRRQDLSQEQVKLGAKGGPKDATNELVGSKKIGDGEEVDSSKEACQETIPVEKEKPRVEEQPPYNAGVQEGSQKLMEPEAAVNVEAKHNVDSGAKDNGTNLESGEEPKVNDLLEDDIGKVVDVIENGSQAA